jgi:hypothetical protein
MPNPKTIAHPQFNLRATRKVFGSDVGGQGDVWPDQHRDEAGKFTTDPNAKPEPISTDQTPKAPK